MATPKVTITIGGKVVSGGSVGDEPAKAPITEENLFMTYFQATLGDVRRQWIFFPLASTALGCSKNSNDNVKAVYLYREQSFSGNRSKWFTHAQYEGSSTIAQTLTELVASGWKISDPYVVPLEQDDYIKFSDGGGTPHKAIRAIDRVLEDFNLSTK